MVSNECTADERLLLLIERIEGLESEKKETAELIKDVYTEAKAAGYDTKAMRAIVRLRRMEKQEREEQEAIIDLYKERLGL